MPPPPALTPDAWRIAVARTAVKAHLDDVRAIIGSPMTRTALEHQDDADRLHRDLDRVAESSPQALRQIERLQRDAAQLHADVRFDPRCVRLGLPPALRQQLHLIQDLADDRLGALPKGSTIAKQLQSARKRTDSICAPGPAARAKDVKHLQRDLDHLLDQLLSIDRLPARMDQLQRRLTLLLAAAAGLMRDQPGVIDAQALAPLEMARNGLRDRIVLASDPKQASKNEAFVDGARYALKTFTRQHASLPLPAMDGDDDSPSVIPAHIGELAKRLEKVSAWIVELPLDCPDDVIDQLKRRQATLEADIDKLVRIAPLSHPPLAAAVDAGIGQLDADLHALEALARPAVDAR